MSSALFLASTPLHSFWALGLAQGVFGGARSVLALIDQREGDRDFIAEAATAHGMEAFARVARFPRMGKGMGGKLLRARSILGEVEAFAAELKPEYVAVGNDRRAEFYAALAAAPRATAAYLDDGMYSYLPMPPQTRVPGLSALTSRLRRVLYGYPVEQPGFVGGSRAVAEAWVLLPQEVHRGLAGKRVRRIEPDWFRTPVAESVCNTALDLAGVDAAQIRQLRLLLVLPHESFLREQPGLRQRLIDLARSAQARGEPVAFKRHPRSGGEFSILPAGAALEIPRRLPIELLAPLLNNALVVGTRSTALLSLKCLSSNTEVMTLPDNAAADAAAGRVYRSVGILPLQESSSSDRIR